MKSWDNYFMDIAKEVVSRSKDPNTQVGAVIVSKDNEPISFGYNGMVKGADENYMPWTKPEKYYTVIHAEMNAILFAKQDLKGAKMYVTLHPCENCLKHALQAGIREIYFADDSVLGRFDDRQIEAIGRLVTATGCKLEQV